MGYSAFRSTGAWPGWNRDKSFVGFTVFCNLGGDATYAIDMNGNVVHAWPVPEASWKTFAGHMLPNGNLLMSYVTEGVVLPGGSGAICEIDWDGSVVWKYEDKALHHDCCRLANGNTLVLGWEPIPLEIAQRVKGGQPGTEPPGGMLADVLREIDPAGAIVAEWHSYQALDPQVDRLCPLHYRREWTHCNSVAETADGDILVCFRLTDTVALIDGGTGAIRWRWSGELAHPHDATVLENGNFLVFDNGWHKLGNLGYSRVVEVDPRATRIVWEYWGRPRASFFAAHLGSAQRLPNGNTLVCEGPTGRIFEVTIEREVVWEYTNPHTFVFREDAESPRISRARRYGEDSGEIRGRLGHGR